LDVPSYTLTDGGLYTLSKDNVYLAKDFDMQRPKGAMCNASSTTSPAGAAKLKLTKDGEQWIVSTDCDGDGSYTSYLTRGDDLIEAKTSDKNLQRWSISCDTSGCSFKNIGSSTYLSGNFTQPSWSSSPDLFSFKQEGAGVSSAPSSSNASADTGGWQDAYSTWYTSYAKCCPKSPNYDPKADKTECDKYSACKYLGKFAGGHRTYEQVQKENIAAFYSVAGQDGKADKGIGWWNQNAKNKTILLKKPDGTVMEVQALDTCWDGDTKNNDCTKNANKGGGILIDLEENTSTRFWGSPKNGKVQWKFK